MLESYIRTGDGKDYIDVDCVREALGIVDEHVDIFGVIKKLREERDELKADLELTNRLYKEHHDFVDKVCEAVDIRRPCTESGYDNAVRLIAGFKRERDELKEKCDKLKKRANATYGVSCGYSGDKEPAFFCYVSSYSWEFGAIDTPFPNNSIRVELDLTPTANYKGTFDLEDLKHYIQAYGREKKLGVIESVDYQNAKVARAELAYLYKTVLGKERLDRDLSPHEIMKAIHDEYNKREEFIRELSCSLGFGDPVVKPDNIDQKERDILERVEKLKDGVWPCENSSTFAEHLRKEFPKFCKEYDVAPLAKDGSIHYWLQYIFDVLTEYRDLANSTFNKAEGFRKEKRAVEDSLAELRAKVREIYRSVVDDEWDEYLAYTSALNDINEEYKRVVHNFEERTADWSKAQQELDRYRLAVGSLLDIPKETRDDINAIERSFTFSKKKYESLKEFRDNVCEIFDIPSSMADKYVLKEIHDFADRYDELEDFRADICDILDIEGMLGTPKQNDQYILGQAEKLNDGITSLDRYARLRSNICIALCLGGETDDEDILKTVRRTKECHDALCDDCADLGKDYTELRKAIWEAMDRKPETLPDENARLVGEVAELARGEKLLIEFRDAVAKAIGITYPTTNNFIVRRVEDIYKGWGELHDLIPKLHGEVQDLQNKYDDAESRFRFQSGLRQQWHARWESENERANGEHKRAEKLRKDVTALSNHIELLKISNASQANSVVASQAFKNECRKLKEEKAKVIAALGQDIWDDCVK